MIVTQPIKTALITGPTGVVGMALVEHLLAQKVTVYAVCRPGSPRAARLPQHPLLHCIFCDVSALSDLPQQIPASVDVFYHFAWENAFGAAARNDLDSQLRNVQNTLQAVRAAKALGCHTFIGAGSQAEYGRVEGVLQPQTPCFPENGYGAAKLCAGQMSRIECQKLGLRHIWARILSVYGPYDGAKTLPMSVIGTLLRGETPQCTAGEQQWDYLYSKDIARAFALLAKKGRDGAVYVLGGGNAAPLRSYIEKMRDAACPGAQIAFGALPYPERQVMHLEADLSDLKKDTGFVPQIPFEQGIRETVEWVKQQ